MPLVRIEVLTDQAAGGLWAELGGLLADAVWNGASVGFVVPLVDGEVAGY
jgi:hypothetical protein